jgi:RNA polymerase sigma-70 factor (ECF subfamily)
LVHQQWHFSHLPGKEAGVGAFSLQMPDKPSSDRDHQLLHAWRSGDRQAGEQLFARHFQSIHRFFGNKVGADADELTQRTFLACLSAREQFRAQSSFRTYLFVIARHELYAYLRQQRGDRPTDFSVSSLAAVITSPSGRIARREESGRLRSAMHALPVEQQLLLELHYWHELDAAALAEVFALPPGTVRVRLTRARQALRERLALAEAERFPPANRLDVGNESAACDSTEPPETNHRPFFRRVSP